MAGDWIKMRADLFEHPKVFKIADALGVDEFSAVGMLFAFWAWADKHSVDGRVDAATSRLVDRCAHKEGFATALVSVGWLEIDADGVTIPRFNEHNGDSAKERSLKNQRQARWRASKRDGSVDGLTSTSTSTREEKRREEISNGASAPASPPNLSIQDLVSEGVNKQHATDWLKVRKAKRAPLTQTSWASLKAEAIKAGISPAKAVEVCAVRSWQSFNASWDWGKAAHPGEINDVFAGAR